MAVDRGYDVVAISRDEERLQALAQEVNGQAVEGKVYPLVLDITQGELEEKLPATVEEGPGGVDLLVNNAGRLEKGPLEELDDAAIRRVLEVNVMGVFRVTRCLLPYMKKGTRAHIVNIGSMAGYPGSSKFPGMAPYGASKAAVGGMTEVLAEEFRPYDIVVNGLAIGGVKTEMLAEAFPGVDPGVTPEMMAAYIAGFSENSRDLMNGKVLPVSPTN